MAMLKQSAIVLSSFTSLQGISIPVTQPSTSPGLVSRNTAKRKSLLQPRNQQCCNYAMIAEGHSRNTHEPLPWPEVTSSSLIPTPYQIFNQRKGSPYSKRRFYELVKLYHPDRHSLHGISNGTSYATKLERYRLIVAANEILSDPIRREAYDRHGAGWNGQPGISRPRSASDKGGAWSDYEGEGREGIFQNATWEDWEKWYARGEKTERSPTFFSNGAFVAMIVMFAAVGGVGQATRVGNYSMTFIEQRDALHEEMSKDLMRRRSETNSMRGRDESVHNFLKQRDSLAYGITGSEVENYQKKLPESEVCSSGAIQTQPMHVYNTNKEDK